MLLKAGPVQQGDDVLANSGLGTDISADEEYASLIKLLEASGGEKSSEVYAELMAKEQNVLEVVNRVAEKHESETRLSKTVKILAHTPARELFHRFSKALRSIFAELVRVRSLQDFTDIPWILLEGERKVHIGFLIVVVAFCLFFVEVSS